MKEYNHNAIDVCSACNVSSDFLFKMKEAIFEITKASNSTSETVQKLERIILKDVENYIRPFILDYIIAQEIISKLIPNRLDIEKQVQKIREDGGEALIKRIKELQKELLKEVDND